MDPDDQLVRFNPRDSNGIEDILAMTATGKPLRDLAEEDTKEQGRDQATQAFGRARNRFPRR